MTRSVVEFATEAMANANRLNVIEKIITISDGMELLKISNIFDSGRQFDEGIKFVKSFLYIKIKTLKNKDYILEALLKYTFDKTKREDREEIQKIEDVEIFLGKLDDLMHFTNTNKTAQHMASVLMEFNAHANMRNINSN